MEYCLLIYITINNINYFYYYYLYLLFEITKMLAIIIAAYMLMFMYECE